MTPRNTQGDVKNGSGKGTRSLTAGFNSMMSDDGNHLMYN